MGHCPQKQEKEADFQHRQKLHVQNSFNGLLGGKLKKWNDGVKMRQTVK
jgi:hypothetical protein